jgi:hypothetical protein
MDFFEHQARAQRKRRLLIFYFALAVIGIVATLQIVFFATSTGTQIKYRSIVPLLPEISILLSGLAHVGSEVPVERDAAYAAGVRELLIGKSSQVLQRSESCELALMEVALDRIAFAAPLVKRRVLIACRETVAGDGVVDQNEYELIRAIADALGCPLPPLVAPAE